MRLPGRSIAMVAFLLLAQVADAQPARPPLQTLDNLDFETGEVGERPLGWGGPITLAAEKPQAGAKLVALRSEPQKFASFSKGIAAAPYRGKLIRFRAAVRTNAPTGAGLWLRVDGLNEVLSLDNMSERPVRSADWTWAEIVADIPQEAEYLVLGGILYAGPTAGTAGFDSASLEVIPDDRPVVSPQAKAYLNHALDLLQKGHINKNKADWPKLRAAATAKAAHAQTTSDTYPAIRLAISQLGEKHTLLVPPGADMNAIAAGPKPIPLEATRLSSGILALRLPGIGFLSGPELARYAGTLRSAITEHQAAGGCGWVVDLRQDTGGNVFPMLNGLAPLLGPPPWAGFVDADGRLSILQQRGDLIVSEPVQSWPAPAAATNLTPLAVLLGPRTTSAGEMMALALAGRDNSRSFGAPTAGLTTGNQGMRLPDGAMLVLTGAYELDRAGKAVHGPLLPEQPTPVDQAENAALAWLAQKGCR